MCQRHLLVDGSEKETLSKIRKCDDLDEEVIKALKEMKGEKKKSIRGDEWVEEQGLILFRGKVYVGCWKMLELVMRNYLWPGISKYM